MSVEFEEEKISFNSQNTQAAQYERAVQEKASPLNQMVMLAFALICIVFAFILPKLFNPTEAKEVVYFEDLTEARMRLIPEKEREAYISSLPSRTDTQ